jgi:hypothetical protein
MGWQIVYSPFLFAGDTIINQNGVFIYDGPPTLGNLKVSIAGTAGIDQFGNVYTDNVAAYNIAVPGGGYAQIAANPSTGIPYLVLLPPGVTNNGAPPQVIGSVLNPGAANEQTILYLDSGYETTPGVAGNALLQLTARPNNGVAGSSFGVITADNIQGLRADGTSYPMGHLVAQGTALPQTISTTGATTITGCGAFTTTPGTYKIMIDAQFTANAAAGALVFQLSTSGTPSKIWGNGRIIQVAGAGAGAERATIVSGGSSLQFSSTASGAVGATFLVTISAYVTWTAAGAVTLQAFLTVLADTFVINNVAMTLIPNF